MSVMLEPGLRPVLPVPLEEAKIPMLPVPLREGAIPAGLSAPMQGAVGTVPADAAADVDPIGLVAPLPSNGAAPRGLETPAIADASLDAEALVVAVKQVAGTLQVPDVDTPDLGNNPDSPVSPPPSKVELLLDDPTGHGEAMDSVPTATGDAIPIPGAPPVRFVCAKPGLALSRNNPAVSGRNDQVSPRRLRSSGHPLNSDPSPRDIALHPEEVLVDVSTNRCV